MSLGFLGVPFFFTLSGFILTVVYAVRIPAAPPAGWRFAFRDFLIARAARIGPMYLACLVPALPIFVADARHSVLWSKIAALVSTPILLQAWIPSAALLWNPVGWSLSVEVFLYALFPWLLVSLNRRSTRWALGWATLSLILTAGFLAGLGWLVPEITVPGPFFAPAGQLQKFARYSPIFHLPSFLVGIVAGLLFTRHGTRITNRHAGLITLVVISCSAAIGFAEHKIPHIHIHNWILSPFFGALLVGLAVLDVNGLIPTPQPLKLLGEASYAFYLIHVIVIRFYMKIAEATTGHPPIGWLHAGACLVPAVILSVLCHTHLERPLRKQLLDFAARARQPQH